MIPSIKIQNLQSHKDTNIDFHQGINVVTGITDSGKSGMIRAMKFAALNKPSGDSLRRHHTKKTSVTIKNVTKVRTSSKHFYEVDGKIYKALRSEVPIPVQDILQLSHVNFQEQHDAYFLIGKSPGEVARTLNEVVDLQVIDLSLKEVKSKVKTAKTLGKVLAEQETEQQEKINSLSWVTQADVDYQEVEKHQALADDAESLKEKIDLVLQEVLTAGFFVDCFPDFKQSILDVEDLIRRLSATSEIPGAIKKVEENKVNIPSPAKDIKKVQEILPTLSVTSEHITKQLNECATSVQEVDTYPEYIMSPDACLSELITATNTLTELEEAAQEAFISEDCLDFAVSSYETSKNELAVRMKELKVCPLCGGST